jgi:Histidine kinase-, DNA gyrase B-, and HSP90-like ATPase
VAGSQTGKLVVEPQPTSLCDAILDTMNTLQWSATAKEITLSSHMDCPLPPIYADPTRLRQILVILVENAIKFTPANGEVKIGARLLERDPSLVLLEVSDSGCGISPDFIERIFERMFQVPNPAFVVRKGLGLGLYICKDLVTRQGGQIWATSVPGHGAVFSVTLPVFSLCDLILPAFGGGKRIDGSVALVVTEIGSQTGWLSDQVRTEQSCEVRDILQQCLHSERDVLLPRMGFSGAVELFFIVAATDEIGAEALAERIRKQLDLSEQIGLAGLIHSTSYRLLHGNEDAIKREPNESMETYLEKVAVEVQELMNEETLRRIGRDGQ